MKFTKMQGAGNDFIIINNMEEKLPYEQLSYVAKTLCKRKLSIGADGFMAVDFPRQGGDFRMLFFNADGSLGEMCGNGARCIARYGYEKGLASAKQKIETTAGMIYGWKESESQYKIQLNDVSYFDLHKVARVGSSEYDCAYVELGSPGIPHAIVEQKDLEHIEPESLWMLGQKLRSHDGFPKGANVNFYDVIDKDHIRLLTYERGVEDFTLACGTGAGSTVFALKELGLVSGNQVQVTVPGGELTIHLLSRLEGGKSLFLTGPTNVVAEGVVKDAALVF